MISRTNSNITFLSKNKGWKFNTFSINKYNNYYNEMHLNKKLNSINNKNISLKYTKFFKYINFFLKNFKNKIKLKNLIKFKHNLSKNIIKINYLGNNYIYNYKILNNIEKKLIFFLNLKYRIIYRKGYHKIQGIRHFWYKYMYIYNNYLYKILIDSYIKKLVIKKNIKLISDKKISAEIICNNLKNNIIKKKSVKKSILLEIKNLNKIDNIIGFKLIFNGVISKGNRSKKILYHIVNRKIFKKKNIYSISRKNIIIDYDEKFINTDVSKTSYKLWLFFYKKINEKKNLF